MEKTFHNSPMAEMLQAYTQLSPTRFHMPGHKGKRLPISWDVTETSETDDLSHPSGGILLANEKLAKAYGMDKASMVTCGSTAAIQAMLLCAKGKVLLGRNAHKSAVYSVMLYGLDSVWLEDVTTQGYIKAIRENRPGTVYLTYPDYYGRCVDIKAICAAAHEIGALVLVDSAHGAHFAFSPALPPVPNQADAFCVSLHKTLPCLTQGAALLGHKHLWERLRRMLFRVHTTSPSYWVMASCDGARAYMEENPDRVEQWIRRCQESRKRLSGKVRFAQPESDVTRFAFSVDGYTGYELAGHYAASGVRCEMADLAYVVMLTSPVAIEEIDAIERFLPPPRKGRAVAPPAPVFGEAAYSCQAARREACVRLPYEQARGRIAGEAVGAYPPGIASLLPGERVTEKVIGYFRQVQSAGGRLFGMEDDQIWVWERQA